MIEMSEFKKLVQNKMRGMRLISLMEKYRVPLCSEQQIRSRIDPHTCVRSQLSPTFDIMFAAIDPAGREGGA